MSNIPAIKDAVKGVVKPSSVEPNPSQGAWQRLKRHLSGENVYGSPIDMRQVNYDAMMRSPRIENGASTLPMDVPKPGMPLELPPKVLRKVAPPSEEELAELEAYLNSPTGGAVSEHELKRLLDYYEAPKIVIPEYK